jgi:hypothetical protein
MLINVRDPRQWTYLKNLPKKKQKNPGINQCGEKGGGGYYIPAGSMDLKNSEPSVSGMISRIKYGYGRTYLLTQRTCRKRVEEKKKKNPSINPGQRHLKYTEAGSAIE